MRKREDLHGYQDEFVEFVIDKLKCGLFLGMGAGKTATSLTAISDLLDDFRIIKVLIIAPLRVANTVWKQEALEWEHLKDLKIRICTGSLGERTHALNSNADIYVINRENVAWMVNNFNWKWDMIVIDESSSFKNHSSQRFKALRKVLRCVKSVVLLTGTPTPKSLLDLWPQIYLLDQGERLGRNITRYRNTYFKQDYSGFNYVALPDSEDKIKSAIKDICVTMEVKNSVDRIDLYEYVEMTPKVKKQYKEFKKDFILSLDKNNDEVVEAASSAVLANKLLQVCNGAVYKEDGSFHELHDLKIKALKDIVDDNPSENFLIAYNFKSDLARLKKAFPKAKSMSREGKEAVEWNKGNIKMLLVHPASAGHGLNIQHGGSVIVWFGLNWSLELYQQLNARLHRQGQKNNVRIMHLVMKDGLDEDVLEALKHKAKTQDELLKYLRYKFKVK